MSDAAYTNDKWEQMFRGMMQAHESQINSLKGALIPKNPIDPGTFVDKYMTGSLSPMTIGQLNIDRPALISTIIYAVNPLAAGTLQVGGRVIPFNSASPMPVTLDCQMVVYPNDTVVLTCTGATALFVELMGQLLAGTDWSRIG